MTCCQIHRSIECNDFADISLTCMFQAPYNGAKTTPVANDVVVYNGTNWIFEPKTTLSSSDDQVMSVTNSNSITGAATPSAPSGSDNQVNYDFTFDLKTDATSVYPISITSNGVAVGTPTGVGTQGVIGGSGVSNTYVGADGLTHLMPSSFDLLSADIPVVQITNGADSVINNDVTINVATMVAATALTAGVRGLVPAPAINQQNYYLRGDATWQALSPLTILREEYSVYNGDIAVGGTTITFAQPYDNSYPEQIYRSNGVNSRILGTNEYTIAGNVITFINAFVLDEEFMIIYKKL